jgi:hypothetical protein
MSHSYIKRIFVGKMENFFIPAIAVCLIFCGSSALGLTTVNNNGGDISLVGSSDANSDAKAGPGYLATGGVQNFSFDGGADSGTVDSFVYGTGFDPANTLGGLTFVYELTINANPDLLLGEMQIGSSSSGSYWGSTVQMGYGTSTVLPPASGSLNLGSILNFRWSPESQDAGTYYIVVGTSLLTYQMTTSTVQDGGTSGPMNVLSPADPVPAPEPSTLALLLLPFGLLAFRAFRKTRMA